jgi:hypothetical protein
MYRWQHGAAQARLPANRARVSPLARERCGLRARRHGPDRRRRSAGHEARATGARRRGALGRGRTPIRLAGRPEARACPRRPRNRRRGPIVPGRRRLHRRIHRLPTAAGSGAGCRRRRGLRAARLGASQRPPGPRARAHQRARADLRRPSLPPGARDSGCFLHLAGQGPARRRGLPGCGRPKGGVVRSGADRREAMVSVGKAAMAAGLAVRAFVSSGLPGPKGNREAFVWCELGGGGIHDLEAAAGEVE